MTSEPNSSPSPSPTPPISDEHNHGEIVVRPVGAWVIGGFLVFVICLMWILVAYIFNFRSGAT